MEVGSKRGFRITTGYQRPVSVPALNEQTSAVVVGDLRQSITQRSVVWLSHGIGFSESGVIGLGRQGAILRASWPRGAGEAGVVVVEKRTVAGLRRAALRTSTAFNNLHNRRRCRPPWLFPIAVTGW